MKAKKIWMWVLGGVGCLVLGGVLAVGGGVWFLSSRLGMEIREGDPAPSMVFHEASGETIQPADLEGKVVLLDFWASW